MPNPAFDGEEESDVVLLDDNSQEALDAERIETARAALCAAHPLLSASEKNLAITVAAACYRETARYRDWLRIAEEISRHRNPGIAGTIASATIQQQRAIESALELLESKTGDSWRHHQRILLETCELVRKIDGILAHDDERNGPPANGRAGHYRDSLAGGFKEKTLPMRHEIGQAMQGLALLAQSHPSAFALDIPRLKAESWRLFHSRLPTEMVEGRGR